MKMKMVVKLDLLVVMEIREGEDKIGDAGEGGGDGSCDGGVGRRIGGCGGEIWVEEIVVVVD